MSKDDYRSVIKNCEFVNCGKGIGLDGADGFRIEGNTFSDISGPDIEIKNSRNIELINNTLSDSDKNARSTQNPDEGSIGATSRPRRTMVGWAPNFRLPWTTGR